MHDATEAELVERAAGHDDREAYGELVRRHQSMIRSLLRRLTRGDTARADDLAQEAFVRAYLKLGTFRKESRFSTWLYRIAYNVFLADTRRPYRREKPADEPPPAAALPSGSGAALLRVDLERAMETLSDAERTAVTLCTTGGLTHAEAAEVLDCPLGTVKTHVLRGKQKLAERLAHWKEKVAHEHA